MSGMRSDHGTENSTIESCQMAFSHLVITMLGSSIRNCVRKLNKKLCKLILIVFVKSVQTEHVYSYSLWCRLRNFRMEW